MTTVDSLLTLSPAEFRERLVESLADAGFAVFTNLLQPEIAEAVRGEIELLQKNEAFRPAAIGKGSGTHRAPETRGDGTLWFEPAALTEPQAKLALLFEFVREALNAELYLGLWDWEGHYAIYPPGAFYRRHLDRFQNDSKRTVSMVFFFNREWKTTDGGNLRLELSAGTREVAPESGTAVFFLSEKVPHEVLETKRDRYSFAGWFRTRA